MRPVSTMWTQHLECVCYTLRLVSLNFPGNVLKCVHISHTHADPTGKALPDVARESAWDYDIGSTESIDFVQNCINDCARESGISHHNCRQEAETLLPTRVLHVRNNQVRLFESKGTSGRYCALSYRWGPPEYNYKTTKGNLEDMQKAVPWKELPPLILDAISLTRRLGVDYLWIDALCIVQGDETGTA